MLNNVGNAKHRVGEKVLVIKERKGKKVLN